MQSLEILVNSANGLIREANMEYETMAQANTVARAKIEKNLKSILENLNQKILEIQTSVAKLPIHEKTRYSKVINSLKAELTRLTSLPRPKPKPKPNPLSTSKPQTNPPVLPIPASSMSSKDLHQQQKSKILQQDLDIDALTSLAHRTKSTSIQIGDELSLHSILLDRTESNIDLTTSRLELTNQKLDRFLVSADKYSFTSLCLTILLLIFLIILTLSWLYPNPQPQSQVLNQTNSLFFFNLYKCLVVFSLQYSSQLTTG